MEHLEWVNRHFTNFLDVHEEPYGDEVECEDDESDERWLLNQVHELALTLRRHWPSAYGQVVLAQE